MIEFKETSYAIVLRDGEVVAEFLLRKSADAVLKCMDNPSAKVVAVRHDIRIYQTKVVAVRHDIRIYQTKTEYDRETEDRVLSSALGKLNDEEYTALRGSILRESREMGLM